MNIAWLWRTLEVIKYPPLDTWGDSSPYRFSFSIFVATLVWNKCCMVKVRWLSYYLYSSSASTNFLLLLMIMEHMCLGRWQPSVEICLCSMEWAWAHSKFLRIVIVYFNFSLCFLCNSNCYSNHMLQRYFNLCFWC